MNKEGFVKVEPGDTIVLDNTKGRLTESGANEINEFRRAVSEGRRISIEVILAKEILKNKQISPEKAQKQIEKLKEEEKEKYPGSLGSTGLETQKLFD